MVLTFNLSKKDLFRFSIHLYIKRSWFQIIFLIAAGCFMNSDIIKAIFINGANPQHFISLGIYFAALISAYFCVMTGITYFRYIFFPVEKYKNMIGDFEVEISKEKISQKINGNYEEIPQRNILEIEETKKYYLFFVTKNTACIIPKESIKDMGKFKDLISNMDVLKTKIASS